MLYVKSIFRRENEILFYFVIVYKTIIVYKNYNGKRKDKKIFKNPKKINFSMCVRYEIVVRYFYSPFSNRWKNTSSYETNEKKKPIILNKKKKKKHRFFEKSEAFFVLM